MPTPPKTSIQNDSNATKEEYEMETFNDESEDIFFRKELLLIRSELEKNTWDLKEYTKNKYAKKTEKHTITAEDIKKDFIDLHGNLKKYTEAAIKIDPVYIGYDLVNLMLNNYIFYTNKRSESEDDASVLSKLFQPKCTSTNKSMGAQKLKEYMDCPYDKNMVSKADAVLFFNGYLGEIFELCRPVHKSRLEVDLDKFFEPNALKAIPINNFTEFFSTFKEEEWNLREYFKNNDSKTVTSTITAKDIENHFIDLHGNLKKYTEAAIKNDQTEIAYYLLQLMLTNYIFYTNKRSESEDDASVLSKLFQSKCTSTNKSMGTQKLKEYMDCPYHKNTVSKADAVLFFNGYLGEIFELCRPVLKSRFEVDLDKFFEPKTQPHISLNSESNTHSKNYVV